MFGNEQLAWIELIDRKSGYTRTIDTAALFSFIGAAPRTDWLPPEIETNPSGYILTGNTVTRPLPAFEHRRPFLLETSRPGVFAAGDVRADSIKRIASAVGEGAMAVRFVHEYLQDR